MSHQPTSIAISRSQIERLYMFRFTICDVLWLMVVVGLAVAWILASREAATLRGRNAELERNNSDFTTAVARAGWNLYRDKTGPILGQPVEIDTDSQP